MMKLDHIRDNLRIGDDERSNTVYVDDEPFFTMHGGITAHSAINVVGTDATADHILIGSGTCCHGYIAQMDQLGKTPGYEMRRTYTPDTNAMDILPVVAEDRPGQLTDVITCGTGCSGSGVRHVDLYNAKQSNIIATDEYHSFDRRKKRGQGDILLPRFTTDQRKERVGLTLHKTRHTSLYSSPRATQDITDDLHSAGIDIEATLERLTQYERQHKPSLTPKP